MHFWRKQLARLALLCLTASALVLGYGRLDAPIAGIVAALAFLGLAQHLRSSSYGELGCWALLTMVLVHSIAFGWMLTGLQNISQSGLPAATALFGLSAVLIECKLGLLLLALTFLWRSRFRNRLLLVPALAWLSEMLLNWLFPWYWGNTIGGSVVLRQLASLGGVPLLTLIVWLHAILLYDLGRWLWSAQQDVARKRKKQSTARADSSAVQDSLIHQIWRYFSSTGSTANSRALSRGGIWLTLTILIAAWATGSWLLARPGARPSGPSLRIGLVQTALPMNPERGSGGDEYGYAGRALNVVFEESLKLLLANPDLDLLVLPESAVPYYTTRHRQTNSPTGATEAGTGAQTAQLSGPIYSPTWVAVLAFLARQGHLDVIYNELAPGRTDKGLYHNAISLFDLQGGAPAGIYHKQKLIPFGEYLPGEQYWPALRQFFPQAGRYQPAPHRQALDWHRYRKPVQPRLFRPAELAELNDLAALRKDWPVVELVGADPVARIQPILCYESV
ncbi:MAG: hypothetical protein KDK39_17160, partial [Leptospiraceae bacterium]|nr:hypothetical protein [Leptospiraceae bacterium]